MLNKVIGIISYLPDNESIRNNRKQKLDRLLNKCNSLFKLPIIIVAQNYLESDIWYFKNKYNNALIHSYVDKLGITGARKKLRELFLNSNYDYLIMLDDDIEVVGDNGEEYLRQIDNNPDCFIENNKSRLQLFAISRSIFEKQDFNDISPEKGEGFEDRIFFYTLCKKYPEKHKVFTNTGVVEHALATKDRDSTWFVDQDLPEMIRKTNNILESIV